MQDVLKNISTYFSFIEYVKNGRPVKSAKDIVRM